MKVSLYDCPAHFPFSLARHSWIVIEEEWWEKTRYEVLWEKSWGSHIHKNAFGYTNGIHILPWIRGKYHSCWRLIGEIEWEAAGQLIPIIKNSPETYPNSSYYRLLWPNSNSYIAWILSQASNHPLRLSRRAIGKNYHTS